MHAEETKRDHPHATPRRGEQRLAGTQPTDPVRLWADPLEQWICMVNIDSFRDQLARATNAAERTSLSRRLSEQEARLGRFGAPVPPRARTNHA